jgi:hypothetical protein
MKKILLLLALPLFAQAQQIDKIITRAETERIETYLASNELAGMGLICSHSLCSSPSLSLFQETLMTKR